MQKKLTLRTPEGWRGDVVDLSVTGLRVRCVLRLRSEEEFDGTLALPNGKDIPVSLRVVWASPRDGAPASGDMGLQVLNPTREYLGALAELFAGQS